MKRRSLEGLLGRLLAALVLALALAALLRGEWPPALPDGGLFGEGETITGTARVVDGDSLVVAGRDVRIQGIDAPEARQICHRGAEEWRCGVEATRRLRVLVDAPGFACAANGTDRFGRALATCRTRDTPDIGARMVGEGWAVSFGGGYMLEETAARLAGRGIWASTFVRPREWRATRGDMAE